MPFRLEGLRQTEAAINQRLREIGQVAAEEVIDFAIAVMGEASRNAPIETGDLRASFVVEVNGQKVAHMDREGGIVETGAQVTNATGQVTALVGTSGIPYATRQHEEMTYNHPRGGGPKFLENALNSLAPRLYENLKKRIQGGDG